MRTELKKIQEKRMTFKGIFKRYGTKDNWHGFPEKTLLLVDVTDSFDEIVTDHIWFSLTKGFSDLGNLIEGDIIQFNARVKQYTKGFVRPSKGIDERRKDYKLNNPTKIQKINRTH